MLKIAFQFILYTLVFQFAYAFVTTLLCVVITTVIHFGQDITIFVVSLQRFVLMIVILYVIMLGGQIYSAF